MPALRRAISRPAGRLGLGVIAIAGLIGLGLAQLTGSAPAHGSPGPSPTASVTPSLPAPPSGFVIPSPSTLHDPSGETRWAPVIHPAVARLAPSVTSRVVGRVDSLTPEGTANLVVATAETTRDGIAWVRASLPSLTAADARGWLLRSSLGGWAFVDTRMVIDRRRLSLTLYRGSRAVFRAPVGVGTPANPTPAGSYYVRDRLTSFASPAYGPLAFGTSARAHHLTDWPGGGFIGIHGTDEPGLIPGRISHGCIRLTNPEILRLGRLLPVGTPVTIQ